MAQRVAKRRSDVDFTFSLKPEFYSDEYSSWQSKGVRVVRGDSSFRMQLSTYHGLLCPVGKSQSSLAPPLTWIECLAAGTPIITTSTQGVHELVGNGESALVFSTFEELENWLSEESSIIEVLLRMRSKSKKHYRDVYSLDVVGPKYAEVYRKVVSQ
jgi:hypothetical protein